MNQINLDPELKAKLNSLDQELVLCDEAGRPIGHFLPQKLYMKLMLAAYPPPVFTEEEIQRRRQQKGMGRSLAEIWKSLGQSRTIRSNGLPMPKMNWPRSG
jgi:hypothetical protein